MAKISFKRILERIKQRAIPFDPSCFNDPVALQTKWDSNSHFDSDIRDNKLVRVNKHRLEFRSTFMCMMAPISFLTISLFLLLAFYLSVGEIKFWMLPIPLLFITISTLMIYVFMVPATFDSIHGNFQKSRKDLSRDFYHKTPTKNFCKFSEIYALQLLSRNGVDEVGYELNLVLENAERINVGSYLNKEKLRKDSRILAEFLDKPLWDAV